MRQHGAVPNDASSIPWGIVGAREYELRPGARAEGSAVDNDFEIDVS